MGATEPQPFFVNPLLRSTIYLSIICDLMWSRFVYPMSSILLIIFYILYLLLLAFHLLFLVFILYPLSCLSYLLLLSVFLDLLWMFYLLSSILIFDHLISFLHGCFPSHILYLPTPSTLYPPSCMVIPACSSFIFCLLSSLFPLYLLSSIF